MNHAILPESLDTGDPAIRHRCVLAPHPAVTPESTVVIKTEGSRKMIELMHDKYQKEYSKILGNEIFKELKKK